MTVNGPWQLAARGAMLLDEHGTLRTTIFAEMSALAARTGAINLGQGFPDQDGPPEVIEAARQAIADGVNQYPPGLGMAVLREAIAEHQQRFYALTVDPDLEVLVTAGATEALAATILALAQPGDDVVTLEPFFDSYGAMIGLSGARHVTVKLHAPEFLPDHDELRAAITDRTKLILINSPHNPTGTVLPRETLALIVELATAHNALIVTDEVYEHLVFEGQHTPIASLPGARERTITISSGGKTFSVTGWKIGWIVAPRELLAAITAVKQFLTYVNGAPFQPAIAVGLRLPDRYFRGIAETLTRKRDLLAAGLTAAGFAVHLPAAGYFVVADAAPLGLTDGATLCRQLPELAGVAAVPISAFVRTDPEDRYGSLLRFAYCKREDVLAEAVDRLAAWAAR
jgi:N-succinyldiaminopimelate aminotransferase